MSETTATAGVSRSRLPRAVIQRSRLSSKRPRLVARGANPRFVPHCSDRLENRPWSSRPLVGSKSTPRECRIQLENPVDSAAWFDNRPRGVSN